MRRKNQNTQKNKMKKLSNQQKMSTVKSYGRVILLALIMLFLVNGKQVNAQSANIDQARNGSPKSPINPVQWVNGNAGSSNSHYLESLSIPYRMVVSGLTAGSHYVEIEWDVKKSDAYAIDYITHFSRLEPHAQFKHVAEVINPLSGLTGINPTPVTYAIPSPTANIAVVCSGLQQPSTSFNALPSNEKVMTMYNGTAIANMQYTNSISLANSSATQRLRITFTTTNSTVVFAWGGHIAAAADWCPGSSASTIAGSPYHMRLISLDGSGGNQDRSLSAAAIIPVPPCNILGNDKVCQSQTAAYSINPYIGYTYTWSLSNNTSGATFSGSNVGSSVTVNSGNVNGNFTLNLAMSSSGFTGNCSKIVNVSKPVLTETHQNYFCGTNTGSINLSVAGGFAPFTYNWSNGATSEDLTGLIAGSYSVVVSDIASCSANLTVNITASSTLSITPVATNVSCFQGASGAISLGVTGGSATYSYSWSNGATTQNISNLTAGSYSVTVSDAAQCSKTETVVINQPLALTALTTFTAPTCFNGNDGSANVVVAGGTAPYSYSWSSGSLNSNASGLSAGTYTCFVTDAKGCTASSSVVLPETERVVTNVAINGNTTICEGGSVTLTAEPSNSYLWSNGATTQSITVSVAGAYMVNVTNGIGCTATSASVNVVVNANPTASATGGAITCKRNEDSVTLTINTNTANANFSWTGPNFNSNLQNPVVNSGGTFSVVVTNPLTGCFSTANAVVTLDTITPVVTATGGHINCTTPNVMLTVTSNMAGVSYLWSGPNGFGSSNQNPIASAIGTYSVIVVNPINECYSIANSIVTGDLITASLSAIGGHITCRRGEDSLTISATSSLVNSNYNWTGPNGFSSSLQNPKVTLPGIYIVTVINPINGCFTSSTAIVTGPVAMTLSTSVVNLLCNGDNTGSASAILAGGTAPFTYQWNTNTSHTTSSITQMSVGTYTVVATDADECSVSSTAIITQPNPFAVTKTIVKVSCNGAANGSITINSVTGGTAPYTYHWNTIPAQTTSSISNLAPGQYTFTLTDSRGCTFTAIYTVTQPTVLSTKTTFTNVTCNGGNNGSLTILGVGGTAPYSYSWDTNPARFTSTIGNLTAGAYTVYITDSKGCTKSKKATIFQPTQIVASKTITPVTCRNEDDGAVTLTVSGGTAPYSYSWNTGSTSSSIINLIPGTYTCLITDALGCTLSDVSVIVPCVFTLRQMQNSEATKVVLNNEISSSISPNPAIDAATIILKVYADSKLVIKIYNTNGEEQIALFDGLVKADMSNTFTVNIADFAAGVYMVRIQTEALTVVRKLVVKKM
jgi:hypothetical protein